MPSNKTDKRSDGWQNLVTLLGTTKDKKTYLTNKFRGRLDQNLLNALYRGDGFGRKIVDLPIYHMLREWFKIEGDTDGEYQKIYKQIKFKKYLKRHLTWDALHGGSLLVAGLEDGGTFEDEVNWNNLKKIDFLKAYDRWSVHTQYDYRIRDPENPRYGEFEFYDVTPHDGGTRFKVHWTRAHRLEGIDISERERKANNYWGDSVLQAPYDYIRSFANVYSNAESIVEDFVQTILSIENLQQLIATGQEQLVKTRMEILDMSRSLINAMILDSNEKFEKKSSSVAGLNKLLQEFAIVLSAVSNIPVTILMGRSPAGMNATGESDERSFYDRVGGLQEDKALEPIDWINKLIVNSNEYNVSITEPVVEFNPLWQPTQEEIIKTHKDQAEIDKIYIETSVLTEQEVRESRFGGETYSYDTVAEGDIEGDDKRKPDLTEED